MCTRTSVYSKFSRYKDYVAENLRRIKYTILQFSKLMQSVYSHRVLFGFGFLLNFYICSQPTIITNLFNACNEQIRIVLPRMLTDISLFLLSMMKVKQHVWSMRE